MTLADPRLPIGSAVSMFRSLSILGSLTSAHRCLSLTSLPFGFRLAFILERTIRCVVQRNVQGALDTKIKAWHTDLDKLSGLHTTACTTTHTPIQGGMGQY